MPEKPKWTRSDYVSFAIWFIPAGVVTWGLHEAAHWTTGKLLGYEMWITFNQVGLDEGAYTSTFHEVLVGMAGPFVTWIQGVVAWLLIRKEGHIRFYSFLFLAFWMRTVAMVLSFISLPNDEAGVSLLLGLPMWILPSVSVTFLLFLTVSASRHIGAGWRGNSLAYVMASLVTTLVVVLNERLF